MKKAIKKIALCSLISLGTVALSLSLVGCGSSLSGTVSITVDGGEDTDVYVGETYTLDATFTSSDSSTEISGTESWAWSVDTNTGIQLGATTGNSITVTPEVAGTYTLTATYSLDGEEIASGSIALNATEEPVSFSVEVDVSKSSYMEGEAFSSTDITVYRVSTNSETGELVARTATNSYTLEATSEDRESFTITDGYEFSTPGTYTVTATISGIGSYSYELTVTEGNAAWDVVQLVNSIRDGASFTVSSWELDNNTIYPGDDIYTYTDDYFVSYDAKQAYAKDESGYIEAFDFDGSETSGYNFTARNYVYAAENTITSVAVGQTKSFDDVYDIHDVANPTSIDEISLSDFDQYYEERDDYTVLTNEDAAISLLQLAGFGEYYGYLEYIYEYSYGYEYTFAGLGIQIVEDNTGDTHYFVEFLMTLVGGQYNDTYYYGSINFDIHEVGTASLEGFDDFLETDYEADTTNDDLLDSALESIRGENFSVEIEDYTSSTYGYIEQINYKATESGLEWSYYLNYPNYGYYDEYSITGFGKYDDDEGNTNYFIYGNSEDDHTVYEYSSDCTASRFSIYRPAAWYGVDDGTYQVWAEFDTTPTWTRTSIIDYAELYPNYNYNYTEYVYLISNSTIAYWWNDYYFLGYIWSNSYTSIYGWDLDSIALSIYTDNDSGEILEIDFVLYLGNSTTASTYEFPDIDGRLAWDYYIIDDIGTTTNESLDNLIASLKEGTTEEGSTETTIEGEGTLSSSTLPLVKDTLTK